jgi:erythromycin esterase-like protein
MASARARFLQRDVDLPSVSPEDIKALSTQLDDMNVIAKSIEKLKPHTVLIGEGSHGSSEYYTNRINLTKKLIEKGHCQAVMIEGDLPDTSDLHRFVMHHPSAKTLDEVFQSFERFPSWMWANEEMYKFVDWLYKYNKGRSSDKRVGIWGLDLYSMTLSMKRVLEYLEERDPEMANIVRADYSCFGEIEPQTYGILSQRGLLQGCHGAAMDALAHVSAKRQQYAKDAAMDTPGEASSESRSKKEKEKLDTIHAQDDAFITELNAAVVVGAEEYYCAMFDPTRNSCNLRDTHFFKTLKQVQAHLKETRGGQGCACAWAHNSHLGDARATHLEQLRSRDLNLGQLVREAEPYPLSVNVGQLCWSGSVCAANDWGQEHQFKKINKGLPGSHEDMLHQLTLQTGNTKFVLDIHNEKVAGALKEPRLQRAIGVIYRPDTERMSHYYKCDIVNQYDFVVFEDLTNPVTPLIPGEPPSLEPETFPTGL